MSKVVFSYRKGAMLRHRPARDSQAIRRRRNRASLTKAQRQELYERDGFRCVTCGSTTDLTADHIIPVAKGGTKDLDNLQTLCGACNFVKGDRLA
jgi:5-methylcytosine-specific restriction endonuclease McrA